LLPKQLKSLFGEEREAEVAGLLWFFGETPVLGSKSENGFVFHGGFGKKSEESALFAGESCISQNGFVW